MNFFTEIFDLLDGIDIKMTIKRKNGVLTVQVFPESGGKIKPVELEGTAEEIDEGFMANIVEPLEQVKGLKVEHGDVVDAKTPVQASEPAKKTPHKSRSNIKKLPPVKKEKSTQTPAQPMFAETPSEQ